MNNCPFCNLNKDDMANTIIEETKSFLVTPSKGSLCDGYLLIIPKNHILSMTELNSSQKNELLGLIKKYRKKFYSIYNQFPILFEHGSSHNQETQSSSSITHAHLHIVNHRFSNEQTILKELNMKHVDTQEFFTNNNKNYISYINKDFEFFITYNFKAISQQMRIYIANDLNISSAYNWRNSNFDNNIVRTINKFQ